MIIKKKSNDYWEYNLKKDEFNQMRNNPYKIMEFIRNKYEYKKYINNNDIPPIDKIMMQNNNINNNNFNWNYFNNMKDISKIKK